VRKAWLQLVEEVLGLTDVTFVHLAQAVAETLRISVPTLVDAASGRLSAERSDARLQQWSRSLIQSVGIELTVNGREHIPEHEAIVVMSNHQSHYDIPVLYQSLGLRLRMVAKAELFRIPLWGEAMRRAGMIEVDRSDSVAARRNLDRAREALASGTSIWIAPEGTRSPDGSLGEFKKGGFHLAQDVGARILPVTIDGTRRVLPAKGLHIESNQAVRVTVHAPVTTGSGATIDELVQQVRERIESAL
jgi:1-acyl-sn-glycerol-3-phosphate acyltransferase